MVTRDYDEIYRSIPRSPGIYAFHAIGDRIQSIAYVGSTGNLRTRVSQHLEYRDSSVTTGITAATLNPDYIDVCTWWTHSSFVDRIGRESAELIAFEVLTPTLRSRGKMMTESVTRSQDCALRQEMQTLFKGSPSGRVSFPNINFAMRKIRELEARLEKLENLIDSPEDKP